MYPGSDDKLRPYFLDDLPVDQNLPVEQDHYTGFHLDRHKVQYRFTLHWLMAMLTSSIMTTVWAGVFNNPDHFLLENLINQNANWLISTSCLFSASITVTVFPFLFARMLFVYLNPFMTCNIMIGTLILLCALGFGTFLPDPDVIGLLLIYTTTCIIYLVLFKEESKKFADP